MQHFTSLQDLRLKNSWLTIGAFDGVHVGHQQILQEMTAGAHQLGLPAVVLTFYPHPLVVLRGIQAPFYLTMPEEKALLLGAQGVDVVLTHPFSVEISRERAPAFLQRIKRHLGFTQLWVGKDFAMGRHREGDVPMLADLQDDLEYTLHIIEPVVVAEQVVSSTLIRRRVQAGAVDAAAEMLGRPYTLSGVVLKHRAAGHTPEFPMAALSIERQRILPAEGVYLCRAQVNGEDHAALVSVGPQPEVDSRPPQPLVEAHLLDFDVDIYGQELSLEFHARLRAESLFSASGQFAAQMQRDLVQARQYFAQKQPRP